MDSIRRVFRPVFRYLNSLVKCNTPPTGLVNYRNGHKSLAPCYFSTSQVYNLKNIQVKTEGNVTEISGVYIEDLDKANVVKFDAPYKKICSLCPHRLKTEIKYTDVLVLSQFMRPDGCVLPRSVTGNCVKAQKKLEMLVHKAQRAGLMPELRPDFKSGRERTSLKSGSRWKRYNIFYND